MELLYTFLLLLSLLLPRHSCGYFIKLIKLNFDTQKKKLLREGTRDDKFVVVFFDENLIKFILHQNFATFCRL